MACGFCSNTPVSPCPVCEVRPVTQILRRTPGKAPARPVAAPKAATPAVTPPPAVAAVPAAAQAVSAALVSKVVNALPPGHPVRTAALDAQQARLIREVWAEGQVSLAGIYLADILPAAQRAEMCQALGLIDDNANRRGFITEANAKLRARFIEGMAAEWKRVHGFDPRFDKPTADNRFSGHPSWTATVNAPAPKAIDSARPTSPERPALLGPKTETEVPTLALGLVVGDWATLNALVNSGTLTHAEAMAVKARWDAQAKATDDVLDTLLRSRPTAKA